MVNNNNVATEVVGSAMEINQLSALPVELLPSKQGFDTQPLLFYPWKMANYNNMATTEVVGLAMEIDRLSVLPNEFLLSIQGFGTQPLRFNLWKMANYNNMATTEVVGSAMEIDRLSALPDELLLSILGDLYQYDTKEAAKTATLSKRWRFLSTKLVDRLSALPDDLLVDILRRLDNTKEAAAGTAALSKRWRFLWTKLPFFSFSFLGESRTTKEVRRSFGRVREALAVRKKAATLYQDYCSSSFRLYLSVYYYYDTFAGDLIALFNLASESRVSEVDLNLVSIDSSCSLPHALYSYPSLRMLSLGNLKLVPQETTVEWGLMTEISLFWVDLPQQALDQIVSGCPLLSRLKVRYCSGFYRLDVRGKRFRDLDVAHGHSTRGFSKLLEISAPYMTSLNVDVNPVFTTLRLTDVSSVEQFSISCFYFGNWEIFKGTMLSDNEQLFQLLQRVTTLVLDRFLEVLLNRMKKGGQLPQFRAQHLTIVDDMDINHISGILAILGSSPFVEKLVIHDVCWRSYKSYRDPGVDLICGLLHLKTVEIIVDIDRQLPRQLSFTLAQILLSIAPVLEEMVIRVERICKSVDYSEFVKKFETLLTYPKSSPKAVVHLIYSTTLAEYY